MKPEKNFQFTHVSNIRTTKIADDQTVNLPKLDLNSETHRVWPEFVTKRGLV